MCGSVKTTRVAAPPGRDPALEGRSAPLVLSRRVTQAQLHALLARLHKVAPWVFRLWWLKPDALVPTLLAVGAQTLRAAGLQSGAQIKMRLEAPVRGGVVSQASVHSKPAVKRQPKAQSLVVILSSLDDGLVAVLKRGDIRFVRSAWLLLLPPGELIPFRQKLEELELQGASPSPLMNPAEAVALLRKCNRSVGALTYGWLSLGSAFAPSSNSSRISSRAEPRVCRSARPCGTTSGVRETGPRGAPTHRGLLLGLCLTVPGLLRVPSNQHSIV